MEDTRTIRLMITRMVLENFKSYAGVQEIGPFHKRFSSIVGPNGSGKSNVIDALLFVFGKRAKQLRLNKVSELIHNSSRYPNLEYAKVEIHFQLIRDDESSQDDFEVVSGSEFIVSRIAYKNNESKYTVDGKKSSYTDVGQLLRSHSIDLDNNRFLILQGEVEQIAMMKPKAQVPHEDGLLEYLEDIIGSNRFVEKIEESSKIVDALNEARIEKVKRLQLAQSDRDGLQGPRDEAYAFLVKEAEIRHKLNVLYQIYIHEANVNLNDLEERKKVAVDKLTYERSKMADSESKLNIMKQEYTQINAEYDKLVEVMTKTSEVSNLVRCVWSMKHTILVCFYMNQYMKYVRIVLHLIIALSIFNFYVGLYRVRAKRYQNDGGHEVLEVIYAEGSGTVSIHPSSKRSYLLAHVLFVIDMFINIS